MDEWEKCEGCPFDIFVNATKGEFPDNCGAEEVKVWADCHLTESGKALIFAMLAGEWKCETCQFGKYDTEFGGIESIRCEWPHYPEAYHECGATLHALDWFCPNWQPRDKPCTDQFEGLAPIPDMPEPEDLRPCPCHGKGTVIV